PLSEAATAPNPVGKTWRTERRFPMSGETRSVRLSPDTDACRARAVLALDGLSVGDAFGQRFFYAPSVESLIADRAVPNPPWQYTDDTEMALAVLGALRP